MAFQQIELNMIPHGDMPSFYASQYETGRPIIFNVMMGEDAFACDNLYVELHCRKVDDNIVTLEPDSVDGNQVTFVGTDQLFACPGQNLAELCLYADETKDTSLGSLNFFIEVEPDPLAGGLTSETQIHDLYEQVEEITQQVIGDDYYDKTATDALLDAKADKSDTYTKSETNTLLSAKADASSVYTKSETNTLLSAKADASSVYTKSETNTLLSAKADASSVYTKSETNTLLSAKANTADLATVATTGDYDDLTNKPTIPAAQVQSDYAQSDNTKVDYIKNKPDLSVFVTSDALSEIIYDLLPVGTASGSIANFDTVVTMPLVDCKANIVASQASGTPTPSTPLPISGFTSCTISVADENMSVQDTHTVSWQDEAGTVYGGVLDTRGKLTVTWGNVDLGSINYTYNSTYQRFESDDLSGTIKAPPNDLTPFNGLCEIYSAISRNDISDFDYVMCIFQNKRLGIRNSNYTDAPTFKTAMNGKYLYYELATPFDIDLTPVQINALMGVNNVYNDTNGDTEVKYKDGIQHYIDTRI